MAANKELQVTSFDHDDLKSSLIEFLKSTQEFGDFDYEGSYINTLVDLLVRNSHYSAYLANFVASESFMDSAQIRSSAVSHALKLSYVPRSRTASRLVCDVVATPQDTNNIPSNIVMDAGTTFLVSDGNSTFSFVSHEDHVMTFSATEGGYVARDVDLYQGQRVTNQFVHTPNTKIEIPNPDLDTSTMLIEVAASGNLNERSSYRKADSIQELDSTERFYFLGESVNGLPTIEFGRDILGEEPADQSVVYVTGINVEKEHAIGNVTLVPASTIAGYSNITATVTSPAIGGDEREDIESIRYLAPKVYQAQERALTDSDYVPLIKRQFPFIKSAITWGGEKNDPPRYGSVFISILSQDGGLVTSTIKQQIAAYVSDYNVGSITPIITDPTKFGLDISVAFAYDSRKTNKSFNELSSLIVAETQAYNNTQLNDFGLYYNESRLLVNLNDIKGIETVDIEKEVFYELDVLRFSNPVYQVNFDNAIVPGSVRMEDFMIASNGTDHILYDDEDGNLLVDYTVNGTVTTSNVGEVDYDTGVVEFTINMIQEATTAKLYIKTTKDNFYVEQNRVVYIDEVNTSLLETRTR